MKVLATIVIPPHLGDSGAVNAAMQISQSLTQHCEIDVALMSDRNQVITQGNLRVIHRRATNILSFTHPFLPNKYRTLFYRSDMDRLVANYDLVHIHNPIPAVEMRKIAKACVAKRIPYVVTTHGFVEMIGMNKAYRLGLFTAFAGRLLITKPMEYVIRHASKICCLAPQDRDLLRSRGEPEDKLVVIPNGVDLDSFATPSPQEVSIVCEKFGLPLQKSDRVPVCFFLANHTRNKGLDVLIEAFHQTEQPFCLIVGGKKRDYNYSEYSRKVKKQQRILFTDKLSNDEIRILHHYSDLFVFPTRADTLPLVVLEAMASSKPILSTKVGGIPFQVDSSCGVLVEPDDPTALRRAFEELVRDRSKLQAMGRAAREKVSKQFDWATSAAQTMDVYRQVVSY